MKKIIGIVALSVFVGTGAFAQTPNVTQLSTGFEQFSKDMANSLPFASTMGLNWSWAYIGNLPHFGAGLSLGSVFIPATGFNDVAQALGYSGIGSFLPLLNNPNLGIPLPAYTVEGRIGGILLPFDVGIKVGLIPPQLASQLSSLYKGMKVDFHLYGIQARYQLVKERKLGLRPEVSVGVGFNHYDGNIGMPVGSGVSFPTYTDPTGNTWTVSMSQPNLFFDWNSNSLDATVQVSKHVLFFLTPYIGAGLSYGFASAGGGVNSTVSLTKNGTAVPSSNLQSQLNTLATLLGLSGQTVNFTPTSFSYAANASGFTARAFGGVSVNIFWLKIDGTLMYNVMSGKIGATVGTRLQF